MTRAEILKCLTDRPCEVCRFHESGKCERWDCVFEEKPDDCDDAISRISVLDTLDNTDEFMDEERTVENYKALLKECYEVLPSVTPKQRWIPVHERLPEEYCLFCDIDGDVFYGHIYDGRWWAEGQDDRIKNVIAWMPLPEPYKEENEVTQDADNN